MYVVLIILWIITMILIVHKTNRCLTISTLRHLLEQELRHHAHTRYRRQKEILELIRLRSFHRRFTRLIEFSKRKKTEKNDH